MKRYACRTRAIVALREILHPSTCVAICVRGAAASVCAARRAATRTYLIYYKKDDLPITGSRVIDCSAVDLIGGRECEFSFLYLRRQREISRMRPRHANPRSRKPFVPISLCEG